MTNKLFRNLDLSKLTSDGGKEKQKIVLHSLPLRKDGTRKPNPKQLLLDQEHWGHHHDMMIDVCLGTTRSGKTTGVTRRVLRTFKNYANARIIIGSINFDHLEKTIIKENFKPLLSVDGGEFNHPFLKGGLRGHPKIGKHNKILEGRNGATITFVNLSPAYFSRVLGMTADIFVIEEASLLPHEDMFDTILTRMASMAVPWKHVMLTGNPLEDLRWMYDRFKLDQFDPEYAGPPLAIGNACECQYCQICLAKNEQIEVINQTCPQCGEHSTITCPGRQQFQRVIQFRREDNDQVHATYFANLRAAQSKAAYERLGAGVIRRPRRGKCYSSFSSRNILSSQRPVDLSKDLVWSLDFNKNPQCSVIAQEHPALHPLTGEPTTEVHVVGEIVKWTATPEVVAKEFVSRYKEFAPKCKVHIYGDPNGAYTKVDGDEKVLDNFTTIIKYLEKNGFEVENHVRQTVYHIADRHDATNDMFEDGDGYRRLKMNPAPHCEHLILSAEKVEYAADGKKQNDNIDKAARKSGRYNEAHPLTHPMDALGYYLIERFPRHGRRERQMVVGNSDTGMVTTITAEGTEKTFVDQSVDEEVEEILDELKEEYEDMEAASAGSDTFAGFFKSQGMWGIQ